MGSLAGGFLESVINGFSVPLLILFVSLFRRERLGRWLDLTTVIGYAVYVAIGTQLAVLLIRTMTRTYDRKFLRLDEMLGFHPVAFADAASHHPYSRQLVLDILTGPVKCLCLLPTTACRPCI